MSAILDTHFPRMEKHAKTLTNAPEILAREEHAQTLREDFSVNALKDSRWDPMEEPARTASKASAMQCTEMASASIRPRRWFQSPLAAVAVSLSRK